MRFIYSIKDRCIYTQILNAFEFDLEHNGTIKTIRLTKEIDMIDAYAPCTFLDTSLKIIQMKLLEKSNRLS